MQRVRTLSVIGIGVGDPDYVTVQAVEAMNAVDVFFVLDKGPATADLVAARRAVCERHIRQRDYRFVEVADPPRDRIDPAYSDAVRDWRDERARVLAEAIARELGDDDKGGFLVWGDPSLYDGTIRVIETILGWGELELAYEVIPGISSIHALTARHRIMLNRVAGAVHVITGRRLAEGFGDGPPPADDLVVMLDADPERSCRPLRGAGWEIYWGAYLGSADELLVAGGLDDVIDDIAKIRREARERKGWIMDSYLLRRAVTDRR